MRTYLIEPKTMCVDESCFTPDLIAMADWLIASGVETAATESAGVYWIPVFQILETRTYLLKGIPSVPAISLIAAASLDCPKTWLSEGGDEFLLDGSSSSATPLSEEKLRP